MLYYPDIIVFAGWDVSVVSTNEVDLDGLQPCCHEKVDTRILFHATYCTQKETSKIMLRTVDTDIVVLAVSHFGKLNLEEM